MYVRLRRTSCSRIDNTCTGNVGRERFGLVIPKGKESLMYVQNLEVQVPWQWGSTDFWSKRTFECRPCHFFGSSSRVRLVGFRPLPGDRGLPPSGTESRVKWWLWAPAQEAFDCCCYCCCFLFRDYWIRNWAHSRWGCCRLSGRYFGILEALAEWRKNLRSVLELADCLSWRCLKSSPGLDKTWWDHCWRSAQVTTLIRHTETTRRKSWGYFGRWDFLRSQLILVSSIRVSR